MKMLPNFEKSGNILAILLGDPSRKDAKPLDYVWNNVGFRKKTAKEITIGNWGYSVIWF